MAWSTEAVVHLGMLIPLITYSAHSHSHGHGHGQGHAETPGERPQGFHDDKVVQDREHIGEHLDGLADLNVSQMTPGELEFHYFRLHDFDNNSMLDGLEIYKALTHLLPYDELDDKPQVDHRGKTRDQVKIEEKIAESKYYTEIVDTVLLEDDLDDDGYLTYPEYLIARHREQYDKENPAAKQTTGDKGGRY